MQLGRKKENKKKNNHVSSIWDASRSLAEYIRWGRMEAGVKIVEILTFTSANRAQVKALEGGHISFRVLSGCTSVCDHVHKCSSARLGPSGSYFAAGRVSVAGLTDGEWVWVMALRRSDESPSLSLPRTLQRFALNEWTLTRTPSYSSGTVARCYSLTIQNWWRDCTSESRNSPSVFIFTNYWRNYGVASVLSMHI